MVLVVPWIFAVFLLWINLVSLLLQAVAALLEALLVAGLIVLVLLQLHLQMLHHLDPVAFGVFFLFLPSEQVPPVALLQHYLEQALDLFSLYLLMANIERWGVLVLNPMLWLVEAFFVLLWAVLGLRFGHHLGERRLAHGPDFV